MTTLNYITKTEFCNGCNTIHEFLAVEDCDRCQAHGPSHEPFTKGHRPHCTMGCCFQCDVNHRNPTACRLDFSGDI